MRLPVVTVAASRLRAAGKVLAGSTPETNHTAAGGLTVSVDPTDASAAARREWATLLAPVWLEAMKTLDPNVDYPYSMIPMLAREHLEKCRLLPNREELITKHLPKGGRVAEVGTFRGHNARTILSGAQPDELHLIDVDFSQLERTEPIGAALQSGQAVLNQNDSVAALLTFPDGYFDWIYIDGDHSYEGVTRDIAAAAQKVKHDGLLVFNDYTYWSHAELVPYGVIHGVNELCLREGWYLEYYTLDSLMYCDVAIRRMNS